MTYSQSLKLALKSADPIVRNYVRNLESEISKLQKQNAKLECTNMSNKHKISALQKKLNAYLKKGHITVVTTSYKGASKT